MGHRLAMKPQNDRSALKRRAVKRKATAAEFGFGRDVEGGSRWAIYTQSTQSSSVCRSTSFTASSCRSGG